MTTKTKPVHENLNLLGNFIAQMGFEVLSSDPATTYARIYYNSTSFVFRQYANGAWSDLGSGGGGSVSDTAFGVGWDGDTTNAPSKNAVYDQMILKATLASPTFTGSPAAPTASASDNSTKLATTAYADRLVDDTAYNAGTWDAVTGTAPSKNAVRDKIEALDAAKANLASPTFTGTPAAPTAAGTTNTTQIATTAMVQAALAAYIAAQDVLVFKGVIDCSANPNYPAADAGHVYKVSVAGKIGGASGPNVEVGDVLTCITDGSSAGTHASVGANWIISQVNIDGAVTGPASSTSANLPTFNGTTGKIIQDSGVALSALATLASPTFTGNPVAPTPSAGDNDTSIATTAFVNTAIGAKRYAADIGDGSTEDITVTHSFGTRDVSVTVRDASSPYAAHDVYWEATSTSVVTIFFPTGAPPANASLRVLVQA